MLDSLKYVKQLQEVGFSREQAETHMMIVSEIMKTHLATHQDIVDLRQFTEYEFKDLRKDFEHLKEGVQKDIAKLEKDLTIRLGTIISIAIGIAVSLSKLIG